MRHQDDGQHQRRSQQRGFRRDPKNGKMHRMFGVEMRRPRIFGFVAMAPEHNALLENLAQNLAQNLAEDIVDRRQVFHTELAPTA